MPRINPGEIENYQSKLNGEWFQLPNDKDVARVQFMHDTYNDIDVFACHRVKVNEKERYVSCLRTYDQSLDLCPFCAEGYPVKVAKFVTMFQHNDEKVKIWERGKEFLSQLQALFDRYSPLPDKVFEIERHGKAGDKDTKYAIFHMDNVEPLDLTEIERPVFEGGVILKKTSEEMTVYLQVGMFPADVEEAVPATVVSRRVPANTTRTAQVASQATPPVQSRRGGVTPPVSPRNTGKEVF